MALTLEERCVRRAGESAGVKMSCALFAADTAIVGTSDEIDGGVRAVKSVVNTWEE